MTTEYLIELIKNNTRVIIPEFGAFLIKDDGSGVFKPENLTFSPFLRYNDGMLEDNLASAKKITKDKAKELLANYTESLKQELTEKGTYELHEIGKLYLDKRGSIHFDAITATGNTSTEAPKPTPKAAEPKQPEPKPTPKQEEVKKEVTPPKAQEKKTEVVQTPEKKVEEKTVETPTKTEPKPVTPKQEPQKEKKIEAVKLTPTPTKPKVTKEKSSGGTGKAILIGSLIGLALVVIVAGGWYMYDSGIFSSSKKEKVVEDKTMPSSDTDEKLSDEANAADEPMASDDKQIEEKQGKFDDEFNKLSEQMDETSNQNPDAKPSETRISNTETPQSEKVAASYIKEGMYHLIVGSFRNVSYAEKFSDDMKTSGFKSRVIAQPTGMHAVTLGSFMTRQEAVDSMNVWKAQHPNIWILNQ